MLLHSDSEGYYVPIEFDGVLIAKNDELAGGMVGSSQRLLAECLRLRDVLGIPEEIDPEACPSARAHVADSVARVRASAG